MSSFRRCTSTRLWGRVRGGLGLLAAVEIVKDRDTKEKFAEEAVLGEKLTKGFLEHRILTRQRGNLIFLSPPPVRH